MAMMNLTITAEDCLYLANPKGCYHVRWLNMDIIHQVVHPARKYLSLLPSFGNFNY